MKTSILSVVLDSGAIASRRLPLCLLAISALFPTSARAQEKAVESAHAAGWVVIPVEEYRVLRAKAYPVEHDPEPPPLDATLTRVDYELRVVGDLASGRANLTVDVLKDGWVRVPVPAGLLVREARLDGKLVSLVAASPGKGGSHVAALLSHAGRSVLTQGIDLRVSGGILSDKSESAGETKWLAYGRGNEALTFTWRRKTEDHHVELPLRLRGSLTQLTSLGEDSTSVYAEANLEVQQGAAHEVRIQIPDKVTINQVSGAMVADWEMKNGELAVSFLEPIEHNARFVINGEARLQRDGIIDVPLLRLLNTERDLGGVAVEILGAGEIKDQKAQGLEDADATDLGEMIASRQSPALVAFKARAGEAGAVRTLSVNVARYDQQAVLMANIEEARYQVLMSADGKELVQARYAIRNNQRNFVKITVPSGATVWSVSLGGRTVRPGQSPDGSLLLPLEKSRGGEDAPAFVVELLYLTKAAAWEDKGHERLTLPALDRPISRTGLLLYCPSLFRLTAEPGTFRTQEYHNPMSGALAPVSVNGIGTGGGVGNGSAGGVGSGIAATLGGIVAPEASSSAPTLAEHLDLYGKAEVDNEKEKKDATKALLDTFRAKSNPGKVTGILPVNVSFPAFGPSIYLVSELTSENQSPAAEFSFQRDKKGGVR